MWKAEAKADHNRRGLRRKKPPPPRFMWTVSDTHISINIALHLRAA